VAFHPDGRRVFVGNEDGKVRVFDAVSGSEIREAAWQAQTGAVIALAISNDGRVVATSGDRTLRFWDAEVSPETGIRRERLQVGVPAARSWMRFAQGDRVFLHVAPGQPLEAWEAP
jgi:WD40 repeat protein